MRYSRPMRVRFGHADPAKIVYYPRFFEWFHDAMEAMFEDVSGRPYAEVLEGTRAGFPAVSLACEFKAPARFGELVDVEVFLSRLGERSGTFEYRVRRRGELLATATVKVSVIDLDTMRSRTWPPELKQQFEPYVEADAEAPDATRLRT